MAIQMAERGCRTLAKTIGPAGERVRVVGAPVSLEDDFAFADSSIGYETAVANAVQFILRVRNLSRWALRLPWRVSCLH
jgi:6-phosphofructokinase